MTDRALTAIDAETSHIPFGYDPEALSRVRTDQVPKLFGALTDPASLPTQEFAFADILAMQNRVSHGKVEAMRKEPANKHPLVVKNGDKLFLADGHHRAVAHWLNGADSMTAHFKDITEMSNAVKVAKVDESLGVVIGWAIVCKVNDADYYDSQGDHIPESVMTSAICKMFADGENVTKDMHSGSANGRIVFAFPMTGEIAKSLGIETSQTGLIVGMKPDDPALLEKYRTGEYTGFSIGGKGERVDP